MADEHVFGSQFHICESCGQPMYIGAWPLCPHGTVTYHFEIRQGQPTHAYYYRNPDGTIGVPPTPDMAPEGVQLERIDSIRDAEKLSKEMSKELYDKFQDHGRFTAEMDEVFGDPIATLRTQATHPKSQLEKDTIPLLIKELEDEGERRTKIETDVKFDFLGK